MLIYLLDDNRVCREALAFLLTESYDHEVREYGMAMDLLTSMETRQPDAIVTDHHLSDRRFTGADVIRIARSAHPALPCILLSGDDEALQRAMRQDDEELRPTYAMTKPVSAGIVADHLARKGQHQ